MLSQVLPRYLYCLPMEKCKQLLSFFVSHGIEVLKYTVVKLYLFDLSIRFYDEVSGISLLIRSIDIIT